MLSNAMFSLAVQHVASVAHLFYHEYDEPSLALAPTVSHGLLKLSGRARKVLGSTLDKSSRIFFFLVSCVIH